MKKLSDGTVTEDDFVAALADDGTLDTVINVTCMRCKYWEMIRYNPDDPESLDWCMQDALDQVYERHVC